MASRYVCTACRKATQAGPSKTLSTQSISQRLATSQSSRPFSTIHRHAASAAPSEPAPYQPKTATSSPPSTNKPTEPSTTQNIARSLRQSLPGATETYVAYGACEKFVQECARQADYHMPQASEKGGKVPKTKDGVELGVGEGWWYQTLNLPPTFETWAQITYLHMYLLTVRFRCFPAAHARPWHQHLIDHFSNAAEDKMVINHRIDAKSERSKYLKDLFVQWRGLQAGYDEGLVKGDAVLATAVWRNVFRGDADVDWRGVAEVVAYMRHILAVLGEMSDEEVARGNLGFGGDPGSEREGVLVRARGMDAKGEGVAVTPGSSAPSGGGGGRDDGGKAPAKGRMMSEGGK